MPSKFSDFRRFISQHLVREHNWVYPEANRWVRINQEFVRQLYALKCPPWEVAKSINTMKREENAKKEAKLVSGSDQRTEIKANGTSLT